MPELTPAQAGITDITPNKRLSRIRRLVRLEARRRGASAGATTDAICIAEDAYLEGHSASRAWRKGARFLKDAVERGGTGVTPPPKPA